jgi:hypothetical protein
MRDGTVRCSMPRRADPGLREGSDEREICRMRRGCGPAPRFPQHDHARSSGGSWTAASVPGVPAVREHEVYAYEEKFSGTRVICKFYGTRFGTDLDKAVWMAR